MPDDFVIKPFLFARKAEVKGMLLEEYNETEVLELFKEKGYEEERRSIMKSLISGYRSGAIKLVFAAQLAGMTQEVFLNIANEDISK